MADGVDGDIQRLLPGIAGAVGGEQRKGHALAAVLIRQHESGQIAGDQQSTLVVTAVLPTRGDGVDHIFAGQAVGGGQPGAAGGAVARQKRIGGVDDGVHVHLGNVILDNMQGHGDTSVA